MVNYDSDKYIGTIFFSTFVAEVSFSVVIMNQLCSE